MKINKVYIENKLKTSFENHINLSYEINSNDENFSYVEIKIKSDQFDILPLIKSHQEVLNVFKDELESNKIHAITVKILK